MASEPFTTPRAVRLAVGVAWLAALGFFLVAALEGDRLSDRFAFVGFGGLAAYAALSLARREAWAREAFRWTGYSCAALFSLGLFTVLGMLLANFAGSRDAFVADPGPKLAFLAAWSALFIVAPAVVATSLSKPDARDWFARGEAG